VRKHIPILKALLEAKGIHQGHIAERLGYKSASAIGMKLREERGLERRELEVMCEMAGITVVHLASISDDLHLTKRPEASEGAVILDELDENDLHAAMTLLRTMRNRKSDS
jgi:transcriptional regulator with XRE-family HTH domain